MIFDFKNAKEYGYEYDDSGFGGYEDEVVNYFNEHPEEEGQVDE